MRLIAKLLLLLTICGATSSCGAFKFLQGGIHAQMDEEVTISSMLQDPDKYLDEDVVFSVRYSKKGARPCPLGDDYVNFVIRDRISYISLDKAWIKKEDSNILDKFEENDTVVMKAKVFRIDNQRDPNLLALQIAPE
jgi:hypothetical protein